MCTPYWSIVGRLHEIDFEFRPLRIELTFEIFFYVRVLRRKVIMCALLVKQALLMTKTPWESPPKIWWRQMMRRFSALATR
jgi:hypothetical protein